MINKVGICGGNTTKLPILSNEEKKEQLIEIKNGNKEAREKFVNGNLRLVLSVVQRFSGRAESAEDLFQIGCIGLIKAIDNFDIGLNVQFSTYAVPMIIGEIRRYLRTGMGLCQGQTCAKLVKGIVARELGVSPATLEPATSRAPMRPTEMRILGNEAEDNKEV